MPAIPMLHAYRRLLSLHAIAKLAKRPHFLLRGDTRHDVAGETADDVASSAGRESFLITNAMIEAKVLPL